VGSINRIDSALKGTLSWRWWLCDNETTMMEFAFRVIFIFLRLLFSKCRCIAIISRSLNRIPRPCRPIKSTFRFTLRTLAKLYGNVFIGVKYASELFGLRRYSVNLNLEIIQFTIRVYLDMYSLKHLCPLALSSIRLPLLQFKVFLGQDAIRCILSIPEGNQGVPAGTA
jgi:hypothetical protein